MPNLIQEARLVVAKVTLAVAQKTMTADYALHLLMKADAHVSRHGDREAMEVIADGVRRVTEGA